MYIKHVKSRIAHMCIIVTYLHEFRFTFLVTPYFPTCTKTITLEYKFNTRKLFLGISALLLWEMDINIALKVQNIQFP